MKQCFLLLLIIGLAHAQNKNIYWGSYDLTIPGGSGAGNAVQHLSLPDNAPQFFQFAPFERQPLQGSQVSQPAPSPSQQFSPAPQSTQQFSSAPAPSQRFRPAPQPSQQFRPAPQPTQQFRLASQTTHQFRPAPQPTQQFRPEPSQQFRAAPQQSFQQLTPNVQQSPSQVQSQFSLQTVIGSQQSQGTIPVSTQPLRVFDPKPSSVSRLEQRNNQQHLSAESTRFSARPTPAPVARPQVAPRQEVQPARVETTPIASSRDYEHDYTGDNELSRFQLYQLKKKQGQHVGPSAQPTQQFRPAPQPTQQFRPAPQPQVGQDIVNNEVQINRRKVAVRRKKNRSA